MIRINVNLYPSNGFVYKNPDGTLLRSSKGWNDLITRVKVYRKVNNLERGDPEKEIHQQACENNPSLCSEQNPTPPVPIVGGGRKSLKGKALAWQMETRRHKKQLAFVTPEEAKRRADICAKCPHNVDVSGGCGTCRRAFSEAREDILSRRVIDSRLNACDRLGLDTAVAVHLDEPRVNDPDLPAVCWKKIVV